MSIWIERMEMPSDGRYTVCVTHDSHGVVHWVFQNQDTLEFLKHGAVTEVSEPHGRLGDLDALMLKIREYIDEYGELDENGFHSEKWCAMKEAEMVICEAPTVIPASGTEVE